jgi:heptosyltransferase-2
VRGRTEVLIVKIGAIGDVVMALPMAAAARELSDDVRVTWVCGATVEPLLRAACVADELVVVDDRALWTGGVFTRAGVLLSLWRRLALRKFDLVALGHPDARYRLLTLPVRGRIKRRWNRTQARPWPIWGRYHGDENVRLILGGDGATRRRRPLPAVRFQLEPELAAELAESGSGRIVLVPGAAKNLVRDDALRRWPIERYAELAQRLVAGGRQVVLAGSSSDAWVRDAFTGVPVIDLVGRTDLVQLCGVMQRSDLVVTHDSGPMHLARLARAPLLALFGPTVPYEKIVPGDDIAVLWGGDDLACRPCYDGNGYADCPLNVCLRELTVERVFEQAQRLLEARSQGNVALVSPRGSR